MIDLESLTHEELTALKRQVEAMLGPVEKEAQVEILKVEYENSIYYLGDLSGLTEIFRFIAGEAVDLGLERFGVNVSPVLVPKSKVHEYIIKD